MTTPDRKTTEPPYITITIRKGEDFDTIERLHALTPFVSRSRLTRAVLRYGASKIADQKNLVQILDEHDK